MHRLLALLIPFFVLAASAPRGNSKSTVNPTELGTLWTASTTAETSKDLATATAAITQFQQAGGDTFLASLRLGWLHYSNADYPKAAKAYGKAASLKPTSINAQLGLLNVAQAQLDIRSTTVAAETVLKIQPTNYRALMAIAGLHFAQKDYRKAAASYARTLVTYPDDPDALSGHAWSALRMNDNASAMQSFTLLLSMNPSYPSASEGYAAAMKN